MGRQSPGSWTTAQRVAEGVAVLTSQASDFPRWYQDVLSKAELAETGPVRGTMVIRPWGYAIWKLVQAEIDARIKAARLLSAAHS